MTVKLKHIDRQNITCDERFAQCEYYIEGVHHDFCSEVLISPGLIVKAKALGNEQHPLFITTGMMQLK